MRGSLRINCARCGSFELSQKATRHLNALPDRAAVSSWIRQHVDSGTPLVRIGPEQIALIARNSPKRSVADKQLILLQAIANRSEAPGSAVAIDAELDFPIAWAASATELGFLLRSLASRGLIELKHPRQEALERERRQGFTFHGPDGPELPGITAEVASAGWDFLDANRRGAVTGNQAFVAMAFAAQLLPVWTEGIKPGIESCGFKAYRVDHDLHTDLIDTKMMSEIRNSHFVVADVTTHRQSVYFEAGFAMGLGLPVFWSVRSDDFDNIHFDARHYPYIRWESPSHLRSELEVRIKALIPRPKAA